ncbi:MAG: bifunctional phosphoribosylaminoimidazolecarboxamide formyltransferase/IMP cyclohydrolase, partial [Salinibacterium sp.]|nr:bifunctional phosphoribosylaminoimidazolecarboxamide formyltransferase/IMP cyclohydrolase [Salinibacterium sp.]
FPEMMDGRVKTLHPRVHGGLLMRRDQDGDLKAAAENGIEPIDLVVVNLYPFSEACAQPDATEAGSIEMIDIGGPSMVRSAAKNHAFVAVLVDPADYEPFLEDLETGDGAVDLELRRRLAAKAFSVTADYDAAIAAWMVRDDEFPETLRVRGQLANELRYGENPHQRAALYLAENRPTEASVAWAKATGDKELSFNNYLDANAAFECVKSFSQTACIVVKHKNPCGGALRPDRQDEAFLEAYAGDPLSAYGGIVAFNEELTEATARLVANKERFFEVIVAPGYEGDALQILRNGAKWGKNCRILDTGPINAGGPETERELRWIRGGLLVQDPDRSAWPEVEVISRRSPDDREMEDLKFAWLITPHVTSNAIVFAKNRRLIGVGAGQMSRV